MAGWRFQTFMDSHSNKKLLGAKGIATSNKCLTSSNKKLLGAKGMRRKQLRRGKHMMSFEEPVKTSGWRWFFMPLWLCIDWMVQYGSINHPTHNYIYIYLQIHHCSKRLRMEDMCTETHLGAGLATAVFETTDYALMVRRWLCRTAECAGSFK